MVSNYVLSFTIWIMDHYISLGVELGLTSQHEELSISFWYWDYLISCGISVHTQMKKRRLELVASEGTSKTDASAIWSGDYIDYLKLKQMLCRGLIRVSIFHEDFTMTLSFGSYF